MPRRPQQPKWLASYIQRAFRVRRALTNKALAHRFGIEKHTVVAYGHSRHKTPGYSKGA